MRTPHSTRSGPRPRRALTYGLAALVAGATALMTSLTGTAAATSGGSVSHQISAHGTTVKTSGHFGVPPLKTTAQRTARPAPAVSGVLQYWGGPVQRTVWVYLDFWGSQWGSDTHGVKSYMTDLMQRPWHLLRHLVHRHLAGHGQLRGAPDLQRRRTPRHLVAQHRVRAQFGVGVPALQ